jgi:hypothetical protein
MARRKFIKGLYVPGIDGPTETPLRLATDRKAEIERQAKSHEGNRLNSVAEELALVAVMRNSKSLWARKGSALLPRSVSFVAERTWMKLKPHIACRANFT